MKEIKRNWLKITAYLFCVLLASGTATAGTIRVLFPAQGPTPFSTLTIKGFTKAYPQISVKPIYITSGNFMEHIAKEKCDVYTGDPWVVQIGMNSGILDNLYSLLPKSLIDSVPLNFLSPYVVNKKLYALPTGGFAQSLVYNRTLFQDAGLPFPNYSWTWGNDFLKSSAKITKDKDGDGQMDTYGVSFLVGSGSEYLTVINSYGGQIMDTVKKVKTYARKPSIDAIKLLLDMANLKAMVFSSDYNLNSPTGHPFNVGKAAMRFLSNYSEQGYQKFLDDQGIRVKIGLSAVPKGSKGSVPMIGCSAICMFHSGTNKKDAAKFIQYFMDSKVQIPKISDGVMPTTLEALLSSRVRDNIPSWYINSYRNGVVRSLDPKFDTVEGSMWNDFYYVANDQMAFEEFIDRGSH